MNKRERFLHFLKNEPVDRVPIAFYHHFLGNKMLYNMNQALTSEKLFRENIEGHRRSREKFDPDIVKIMNDSLMMMPLQNIEKVRTKEDLLKLKAQEVDSKWADMSVELIKAVKEIYNDTDAPIFYTSFGPAYIMRSNLARIGNLMAGTRFFENKILKFVESDEDLVAEVVKNISKGIADFNKRLFEETKIDGIYFSVNNQNEFFENHTYRKIFTPGDKLILESANKFGNVNILHICGYRGKANDLHTFKDYDAAVFNWAVHAEGVSLKEGKKFFNGKPVFGGFSQNGIIANGTKEEIFNEVYRILDESGTIGIMIGADCTVPTNFDDTRQNIVRVACEKYEEEHGEFKN